MSACGRCEDLLGAPPLDRYFKNFEANRITTQCLTACDLPAGGGGGPIVIANSLFVNKLGDNATALRERFDLQFRTISAALAAALPGDTVYVYPGNDENAPYIENVLLPVNVHLCGMENSASAVPFPIGRSVQIAGQVTLQGFTTPGDYCAMSNFIVEPLVDDVPALLISGAASRFTAFFFNCTFTSSLTQPATTSTGAVRVDDGIQSAIVLFVRCALQGLDSGTGAEICALDIQENGALPNVDCTIAFDQGCSLLGTIKDVAGQRNDHIIFCRDTRWDSGGTNASSICNANQITFVNCSLQSSDGFTWDVTQTDGEVKFQYTSWGRNQTADVITARFSNTVGNANSGAMRIFGSQFGVNVQMGNANGALQCAELDVQNSQFSQNVFFGTGVAPRFIEVVSATITSNDFNVPNFEMHVIPSPFSNSNINFANNNIDVFTAATPPRFQFYPPTIGANTSSAQIANNLFTGNIGVRIDYNAATPFFTAYIANNTVTSVNNTGLFLFWLWTTSGVLAGNIVNGISNAVLATATTDPNLTYTAMTTM